MFFVLLSFATAYLDYHIFCCLSTTFLILFFHFIASSSFSRRLVCDSLFILACTLYSVNTFFNFFSSYLKKCFISFHALLYHIFQVEQPRDLARDSGQRKLTHSLQNHCASSRSVYLSRRLDSHWDKFAVTHHLKEVGVFSTEIIM